MKARFEVSDFAEIVDYAHSALAECQNEAAFEALAREIARDEEMDVALVRAIGKGSLTNDYEESKPFIQTYLDQVRDDKPERDRRRTFLAELFGVTEDSISSVYAWKKIAQDRGVKPKRRPKPRKESLAQEPVPQVVEPIDDILDEEDQSAASAAATAAVIENVGPVTDTEPEESAEILDDVEEDNTEPAKVDKNGTRIELTDEEKAFIREYVAAGVDEMDKRGRRMEMAELFETGVRQIAAITAWTKIRAQRATQEETETSTLKPDEIVFIQDFVFEASTAEEESERCAEMAEMFDVDVSLIETLVLEALMTDDASQEVSDTETVPTELKGGAHVEYDNLEKNKWREKMKEFILERTTEQERARMKVLCLPGKRWLEATQVYLELGFKPENIHGVERDKTAREEFEATAEELGCQAHFGDLMRFVQHPDAPAFDVVSLDFLGPFSEATLDLLQRIKPTKRQLLLTNFMGKREMTGQVFMRIAKELSDTTDWRSTKGVSDDSRLMEEKMRAGRESTVALAETRDSIWRFLSRYHATKSVNPFYEKRLRKMGMSLGCDAEQSVIWASQLVTPIIVGVEEVLRGIGEQEVIIGRIGVYLRGLFVKTLLQQATINDVVMHEYRSGSGAGTTNYISDFIELEVPTEQLSAMKHSVRFLFDAVEATRQEVLDSSELEAGDLSIETQDGKSLRVLLKGREVSSVRINRVKQDVDIYHGICKQNLWDKIILDQIEAPKRQPI